MTATKEILKLDDLKPLLLLKNGNYLYKVPFRDGWAVLKVYYGSRGIVSCFAKSISNVVFEGQTSYMPLTRLRIERDCMRVWAEHGFRTFEVYDDVEVQAPGMRSDGYLLMEYVEASKLNDFMKDESIDIEERYKTYREFLKEWSRRHDCAIEERDPRLVHENGDGKHVLIMEDGFMWFDFEMVYRSRNRVRGSVSHEIVQYLWNIHKTLPEPMRARFLDESVKGYPKPERILEAYDFFYHNPNLFHRLGRAIDRTFYKRSQKPTSKYIVAKALRDRLESNS